MRTLIILTLIMTFGIANVYGQEYSLYSNDILLRWFAFSDSVLVLDNCLMRQAGSAA